MSSNESNRKTQLDDTTKATESNPTKNDEETDLLASIGSTLTKSTDYESNVLQEATRSLAPTLFDATATASASSSLSLQEGFPLEISNLLPHHLPTTTKTIAGSHKKESSAKNVNVLSSLLSKLQQQAFNHYSKNNNKQQQQQQQQQQQPQQSESTDQDTTTIRLMKQSILLTLLHQEQKTQTKKHKTSNTNNLQLCMKQQQVILRHEKQQVLQTKKTSTNKRLSMMKRKEIAAAAAAGSSTLQLSQQETTKTKKRKLPRWSEWSDNDDDDDDDENHKEEEKKRAKQRQQRRQERKRQRQQKSLQQQNHLVPTHEQQQQQQQQQDEEDEKERSLQEQGQQDDSPKTVMEIDTQNDNHTSTNETTITTTATTLTTIPVGNRRITRGSTRRASTMTTTMSPPQTTTNNKDDDTVTENEMEQEEAFVPSDEDQEEVWNENETTTKKSTQQKDATKTQHSIICPLCQEELFVENPKDVDELLSQHMNHECPSNGGGRLRPRRRGPTTTPSSTTTVVPTTRRSLPRRRQRKEEEQPRKQQQQPPSSSSSSTPPPLDDYDEFHYEDRVDDWIDYGLNRMKVMKERDQSEELPGAVTLDSSSSSSSSGNAIAHIGKLHIPAWINNRLFPYQRIGLEWMWQLYQQEAGGVMGDEMGLGKTVQVCSFLGCMTLSRNLHSVLVVAPATMLQHWLKELSIWAPGLRRVLIHSSGEKDGHSRSISHRLLGNLRKWLKFARRDRLYEILDQQDANSQNADHSFCGTGYVIVTTYEQLRRNADIFQAHDWAYVCLDEAQKIRNPDADVTLACKRLRTPHRIAMTGTPIQNDLRELWSLFDFVFPGRLGTLPAFEQEFSDPIKRGGYSNASMAQVQLAYRCSLILKDLINPYLLRRQKHEIKEVSRMPSKTEHVLFCRLSARQRRMYETYLQSDAVTRIMRGSLQLFSAITLLRKICNHPDLICEPSEEALNSFLVLGGAPNINGNGSHDDEEGDDDDEDLIEDTISEEESLAMRSGKLEVLSKILPLWYKQGHRVLIFCQWRKMLNIIERFTRLNGWKFGRLDGNTNVASRQRLVDTFNADTSYYGLLCTTKTGGVGLNLTGANRIILYDPDWNPQTDAQARERAWRFGQEREVTIYRLITAGTIEEKIYQRQIFKTALTNKVLHDPRQRRLFSQKDLKDLLTLKEDGGNARSGGSGMIETGKITKRAGVVDTSEPVAVSTEDDGETLKNVMKSSGLAGIFDHKFVEQDTGKKSISVVEMEKQAAQIAIDAANALQESVRKAARRASYAEDDPDEYAPTWTGSEQTAAMAVSSSSSRFGGGAVCGLRKDEGGNRFGTGRNGAGVFSSSTSSSGTSEPKSSGNLLASLRQQNAAIKSNGGVPPSSRGKSTEKKSKYSKLLQKICDFIKKASPTTDEILKEFSSIPESEAAIFRKLLNSVARVSGGRWHLRPTAKST